MTDEEKAAGTATDLDAFVERLVPCLSSRVELEALVLFGSRVADDAFDESDWDFAVISSDFRDLDPLARGLLTLDCRIAMVDLVHLTPDELLEPDHSYLRCAILEEGRPLIDMGAFARARERYEQRKAAGEIRFRGDFVEFEPA